MHPPRYLYAGSGKPRYLQILLPHRVMDYLAQYCDYKTTFPADIARTLLIIIADENLHNAIIDDTTTRKPAK